MKEAVIESMLVALAEQEVRLKHLEMKVAELENDIQRYAMNQAMRNQ